MSNTFVEGADGKPRVVRHEHVNMGLAVDVAKSDGSRTLVVPVLRDADELDFAEFLAAYEDLIRKVRTGKLTVTDFQGATITLTNPGTIGTVQSVPRLMPGQGVIVGVGTIDYPAEWQGADERTLGELGVSKVVTVTSTYDHRIIQGAESGMFLKAVHERLMGEHGFYHDVFRSPRRALRRGASGARTSARSTGRRPSSRSRCRWPRSSASTGPAVTSSPTSTRWTGKSRRCTTSSTRPRTGSPSGTSSASSSPAAWPARSAMTLGDLLHVLRDAYCRTHRHRVHAHPGHRRAALDPVEGRGREAFQLSSRRAAPPARAG